MFTTIVITIFSLIVLLFSIIVHELAHGYVAYSLGDPTAKYSGRLTLNPLKHIDPFGSVIFPFLFFLASGVFFGWAKPVPINPYNLKDQKWGSLKVAAAGPAANLALALVFGLILRFFSASFLSNFPGILSLFAYIVQINIVLLVFNLLPLPPLDGSWIFLRFLPHGFEKFKAFLQQYGMFILIILIFSGGLSFLGNFQNFLFYLITNYKL